MDYSLYSLEKKEDLTALANAVRDKTGGTSPLTIAQMSDAVSSMNDAGKLTKILMDRTATEVIIPAGLTKIRDKFFHNWSNLKKITMPAVPVREEDELGGTVYNRFYFQALIDRQSSSLSGNANPIDTLYLIDQAYTSYGSDLEIDISYWTETEGGVFRWPPIRNVIFGSRVRTISAGCALSNDDIRHVIINEGVTSIGTYAFSGCSNLGADGDEIVIPKSVTTIFTSAFRGCTSLKKVKFKGVINELKLPTANDNIFTGCTALEEIVLPKEAEGLKTDADLRTIFDISSAVTITYSEEV